MLRSLIYFLSRQGLDAQSMARKLGLSAELLAERDRLVSGRCYAALMQAAIAATGNPLLGLEFGMAVEPDRWGMLGVLLSHCANVGEAVRFQSRFQTLVTTVGHARLESAGDDVALYWDTPGDIPPALTEEALAAWVNFGRWATGRTIAPTSVSFRHPAQGETRVYRAFFECPVHFGQGSDGLRMPAALLHMPLRNPDPHLRDWLTQRAQRLQAQGPNTPAIYRRLAHWFAEQLPFGVPTLAQAAAALGVSERTLQRQLHHGDTTFKDCMSEVRIRLAEQYLRDVSLSIGDIGFLLGFSEQSAFQRAFKRWHNVTPRAYRRTLT